MTKQAISSQRKKDLFKAAKQALSNPYPKDAETVYSCALLTDKSKIYASAQYFSDTYSLTLHAEQSALAHAAAHGEGNILAAAITSNEDLKKGQFSNPCHMCKQLLYESQRRSGIPMLVILLNSHGETQEIPLNKMMNFAWPS